MTTEHETDIATLEQEARQMRARMNRQHQRQEGRHPLVRIHQAKEQSMIDHTPEPWKWHAQGEANEYCSLNPFEIRAKVLQEKQTMRKLQVTS